ncbi:MAG: hypothetical protein JO304_15665 [Solirubrobacterales bacterium]|nr:hypothetical protein [Solirubrobacterales bacterium]
MDGAVRITKTLHTPTDKLDMTTNLTFPRRWLGLALVVAAIAVAGCGGGGGSSATSSSSAPASSATSASSSSSAGSSSAGGIPQGPNAGDKDSDNQGGPSDGDGNL